MAKGSGGAGRGSSDRPERGTLGPVVRMDWRAGTAERLDEYGGWRVGDVLPDGGRIDASDDIKETRLGDLIGQSAPMRQLFEMIRLVADSQATVLLQGESGTGKELVARTIHQLSYRREKPFVVVDCGSLPETLLESELFGHAKGAFTGAVSSKQGLFEAADGGTIFQVTYRLGNGTPGNVAADTPAFWAYRAFRNFDGKGARFLDWSLPTRSGENVSLFASRDQTGSRLVAIVLNLDPTYAAELDIDASSCGTVKSSVGTCCVGSFAMVSPGKVARTFAERRIRGAMIDALRKDAWPRGVRRQRRELLRAFGEALEPVGDEIVDFARQRRRARGGAVPQGLHHLHDDEGVAAARRPHRLAQRREGRVRHGAARVRADELVRGGASQRPQRDPGRAPVTLEIVAQDVVHSWWVPALGGKFDAEARRDVDLF